MARRTCRALHPQPRRTPLRACFASLVHACAWRAALAAHVEFIPHRSVCVGHGSLRFPLLVDFLPFAPALELPSAPHPCFHASVFHGYLLLVPVTPALLFSVPSKPLGDSQSRNQKASPLLVLALQHTGGCSAAVVVHALWARCGTAAQIALCARFPSPARHAACDAPSMTPPGCETHDDDAFRPLPRPAAPSARGDRGTAVRRCLAPNARRACVTPRPLCFTRIPHHASVNS